MNARSLLEVAASARQLAYAPYSKFSVGAAILTTTGEVFTGCNVENASYGLTSCAERNAVFAAVAAGHREFSHLALVLPEAGSPCGACRQVLNEFAPNLQIIIADPELKLTRELNLTQLLPEAFGPDNL